MIRDEVLAGWFAARRGFVQQYASVFSARRSMYIVVIVLVMKRVEKP